MMDHTLVTQKKIITLKFERTWRAVLGLGEGFHIHCEGCFSVSTSYPKSQASLPVTMFFFLKSFLRRLLEGEVLDRSQHVAPSARLLAAAERISLRRDAFLTFQLKWYDTTVLILHIHLPPPKLLIVDLNE